MLISLAPCMQALLGQLFPAERAASVAAAAAPAGPKPVTRKAAENPSKAETRHSEFKGVHWSVREQTWRAILLHDDKVTLSLADELSSNQASSSRRPVHHTPAQ